MAVSESPNFAAGKVEAAGKRIVARVEGLSSRTSATSFSSLTVLYCACVRTEIPRRVSCPGSGPYLVYPPIRTCVYVVARLESRASALVSMGSRTKWRSWMRPAGAVWLTHQRLEVGTAGPSAIAVIKALHGTRVAEGEAVSWVGRHQPPQRLWPQQIKFSDRLTCAAVRINRL
jgi:hypothetical protein